MSERGNITRDPAGLADKVERNLGEGSIAQAKREFTRSWRDFVPELPLRFSVILVRLDKNAVGEALRVRRESESDEAPQLAFTFPEEGPVQIRLARGKKLRIGDLPHADSELFLQLSKKARRTYKPRLLEIGRGDDYEISFVAVELVRSEQDSGDVDVISFHEAVDQLTGAEGLNSDPGHLDI